MRESVKLFLPVLDDAMHAEEGPFRVQNHLAGIGQQGASDKQSCDAPGKPQRVPALSEHHDRQNAQRRQHQSAAGGDSLQQDRHGSCERGDAGEHDQSLNRGATN